VIETFYMELCFHVTGDRDGLEDHLDQVLESLYTDDRITDADYSATLAKGDVMFSFNLDGEDDLDAMTTGAGAMRAAIHAADGHTPGWEEKIERLVAAVRESKKELVDA
jgi:hypothetical protein